jgi:hypothetical protein
MMSIIRPGNILVVDESVYEFNGECPVKVYIPRKPHPNGLLTYGISGYFLVGADLIPYVLDYEPRTLDNQVSAQDAMMALHGRCRQNFPQLRPHLVVDSAFGSFDKLSLIMESGGGATMSMPSNTKAWLWELLDFNCGIDMGRMAVSADGGVVISSFKVLNETGSEHQIKTISSHCEIEATGNEEDIISRIIDRRIRGEAIEYHTEFLDGHFEWLTYLEFIDLDGTVSYPWLAFVTKEDLFIAFGHYTLDQLKARLQVSLK